MRKIVNSAVLGIFFAISLINTASTSEMKIRIKEIQILGNQYFKSRVLFSCMKLKSGSFYSSKFLEKSTEEILELYEDNGFPYCQIDLQDFNYTMNPEDSTKWLSFNLKIIEGPRVRIRKVKFEGNKDTRDEILNKVIDIDSSEFFSQDKIESGLYRLSRLSFIKKVIKTELIPESDPSWVVLNIAIEENKQNSFLGILGYMPSIHKRSGYFSGKLNFVFDNIFGTGRKTEIAWSKKDPYSFDLAFFFKEPYLFGLPLNWDLDLRQIDYDSSFSQLELNNHFIFSPLRKFSFGFNCGWERLTMNDRLENNLSSSRKYKFGIKLRLDLLDYPVNPRKGICYVGSVIYGRKTNLFAPEISPARAVTHETRFLLDLDNIIPIYNNQVMTLSIHLRDIVSSEKKKPIFDQYHLGGLNSLRGYREEEFSGDRIFWINTEYRFLLTSESRAFIFWDFGYFGKKVENPLTQTLQKVSAKKSGFGLGLKINTKSGIYEVDYALGEMDNFSEGKIHFGISQRF